MVPTYGAGRGTEHTEIEILFDLAGDVAKSKSPAPQGRTRIVLPRVTVEPSWLEGQITGAIVTGQFSSLRATGNRKKL